MTPEANPDSPANLSTLPFFHATDDASGAKAPGKGKRSIYVSDGAASHLTSGLNAAPRQDNLEPATEEPFEERTQDELVGTGSTNEGDYWESLAVIRQYAAELHSNDLGKLADRGSLTDEDREAMGHKNIALAVREHVSRQINTAGVDGAWSSLSQDKARRDIFNYMFRLGRFQQMIDDPSIENIHINGCENVWVERVNGKMEQLEAIADTDEQLVEDIRFLLQNSGAAARSFDQANPDVDADLLESVRLAATLPPVSLRPTAVFRIHRYIDITLEEMVEKENLTAAAAHLLRILVKSERSVVVSGFGGVGKTTLLRALADQVDPYEQIVTIEKERELHLHKLKSRKVPPVALQYRPAGEGGMGEYTMQKASDKALRLNARRIFVGEVRGDEFPPMIRAMQTGAGTFSTTHAETPEDCIDALVGLGSREFSEDYVSRQLARHIDVVVQMDKVTQPDGSKLRKVTHIAEVLPGEGEHNVASHNLFFLDVLNGDRDARFVSLPQNERLRRRLEQNGLDKSFLQAGA